MHFFTFLIVLSFASVHSFPLYFNECEEICSGHGRFLNSSSETCRTGCQYFYKIDSLTESDSNTTLNDCYLACDNGFSEREEHKRCVYGCDGVYASQQYDFKPVPSPPTLGTDSLKSEDFPKMHENRVIPPTDAAEKAMDEDFRRVYYEEYAKLQYTSVIQLSIFCIVLVAIIACSVKVIILIYQFKFAAIKYMLETSSENEMLNGASKKPTKLYYSGARTKK